MKYSLSTREILRAEPEGFSILLFNISILSFLVIENGHRLGLAPMKEIPLY